jgi:hypothetical protein
MGQQGCDLAGRPDGGLNCCSLDSLLHPGMQDPAVASNIQNGPNLGDQYLDVERLAAEVPPT